MRVKTRDDQEDRRWEKRKKERGERKGTRRIEEARRNNPTLF